MLLAGCPLDDEDSVSADDGDSFSVGDLTIIDDGGDYEIKAYQQGGRIIISAGNKDNPDIEDSDESYLLSFEGVTPGVFSVSAESLYVSFTFGDLFMLHDAGGADSILTVNSIGVVGENYW